MKLYRFDSATGQKVDHDGGRGGIANQIAHTKQEAVIMCLSIGPDGLVGNHRATVPQLFFVVQGEGWMRGDMDVKEPVSEGQLVLWQRGNITKRAHKKTCWRLSLKAWRSIRQCL